MMRAGAGAGITRFCLALCAAACAVLGAPAVHAAASRFVIEEGGVRRSATLVEFQRLKKGPRPVVIVLHGGSGSGAGVRRNLGLDEHARAGGAVMIYPDAAEGRWAGAGSGRKGLADDTVYIAKIAEKLIADRIADPQKISIVGVSTGGLLAIRMACTHTKLFTAAAAIIANMPKSLEGKCAPERPLPFLLVNGTADTLVPYDGGKISINKITTEVLSTEATLAPFMTRTFPSTTTTSFTVWPGSMTTSLPFATTSSGSRSSVHSIFVPEPAKAGKARSPTSRTMRMRVLRTPGPMISAQLPEPIGTVGFK